MKKTIRKNFRFSEEDIDNLRYICLYLGLKEAEVLRLILRETRKELESESGAINPSPSPSERSPGDVVERYPEFIDDDPDLPF